MALTTVSSDRLSTNVKNTNFTAAEKQDLTNDILPLAKQFGQSKNLIINGAMQVAQRGTSSTTTGYATVDRFLISQGGVDEAPTQAQVDVASGTTPYTLGFRKAFKLTNGNQTSGAGAADYLIIRTILEAQDIANSGWNYLSSSSDITLSFWVKSSVAQNFYGTVRSIDTAYVYPFETGSLSADTWTKITKTIPGNSNLTFNNDNGAGLYVSFMPFFGTDYTASSVNLNQWAAYSLSTQTPDYTSTWYTTNDATFEITGVQLEVGSVATDFEHRSFSDELMRCYRYYQVIAKGSDGTAGARAPLCSGGMYGTASFYGVLTFKNKMRTIPSLDVVNGTDYWQVYNGAADTCNTLSYNNATPEAITLYLSGGLSATNGIGGWSRTNNAAAFVAAQAEL